jgi:hypothetical protein
VILDDSDDQGRRKALRRAFVLHENSFTFDDLATGSSLYDGADALKSILLTETQPPVSQGLRTKTLSASNLGHPPMAIILIAVVLAVITGLNYFGKPISRTMWLVLFILSSVALVLILLSYLHS